MSHFFFPFFQETSVYVDQLWCYVYGIQKERYLHFHTQTPSSSSFILLLHTHGLKLIIDGSVFSKCRRLVLYLP
jgi:hypothetical protein